MLPDGRDVTLMVNGTATEASVPSGEFLLDTLRNRLGLLSVKEGCQSAACGSCTVLVDGKPRLACITLTLDAVGVPARTVESLSTDLGAAMHPLQEAFARNYATQCGFCAPGMLMSALAVIESNTELTEASIRRALSGNLCRCTGYVQIVRAIADASERMNGCHDQGGAEE